MVGVEGHGWAEQAAAQYERMHQQYVGGARKLESLINELIGEEEGINYLSATARAKDPESFLAKASKAQPGDPGRPKYDDPLDQITDLVAARVITFLVEAVDRVCEVIEAEFEIVEHTDMGAHTRAQGVFGYASKHYLVRLNAHRRDLPEYAVLRNLTMEIQVRTAVQHAWAEFEHDIRYKLDIPPDRKPEFDRRFLLAAALMELADNEFTEIDRLYRELAAAGADESPKDLTAATLTTYLTRRYPDAPHAKTNHYAWILGILARLGVTTEEQLTDLLQGIDSAAVQAAMTHRFPAGTVRRLDDDLLAARGSQYVELFPEEDRRQKILRGRLKALARAGLIEP
ncbi:ppGpp synthetase/RelA/SpoT-type nucleotidyltransferase [Kribbella sp. VKM Ac-2527]|uniref:PpGpp synthetase/RelA/SpoT-type nucleotidyltransferase n=1 Tax=Kribbella caucasensis TaxID=2512215 RepID=A0A4R6JEM0_9ACTN|nr:(p)ppGpp synthetase [Kribbella sp. VKM Ac-2527]TDO33877.1 ppGpp synthetase/RelA/SpoT-type nucleotidyltransferase [Kribbella sp. VKM Ac-2527]